MAERNKKIMKTGFVTLVGRANVGKSTLLNSIIGEKISIISDKPQTTRNKIIGIYNSPDAQIVFVDTPGLHVPKNKLGEHMVNEISDALSGVDIIILVAECHKIGPAERSLLQRLDGKTVILVLNKIDKVAKKDVADAIVSFSSVFNFEQIIPISALRNDGVDIILAELLKLCKEGIQYYPDDMYTEQTVRHMVSELVREKILQNMYEEVPHGIAVEPVVFKERENKNGETITDIIVNIICERETHKGMIIGKKGILLKKMATAARQEMETLLGTKVYLECFVKVKENWRDSEKLITELGLYED